MKPQLMSREDAVSFILDNLKLAFPNAHPQSLGAGEYKIWFTETKADVDVSINVNDVVAEYESKSDVNILIDYLNAQALGFKQAIEKGLDWKPEEVYAKLLPVIRLSDFTLGNSEEKLLEDELKGEFKLTYAEVKSQDSLVWVTQENLKPGYDHDKVVDKALANLKQRGWVKHKRKMHGPGAHIYLFECESHPYQAQFLLKQWTDKHLGKKFFFTFPSETVTLVMVPDTKSAFTLHMEGAISAFASVCEDLYLESDSRALSSTIHAMDNGKIGLYEV